MITVRIFKNEILEKGVYDRYLLFSLYIQIFYCAYGMTRNPFSDGFILIIYTIAISIPYSIIIPKTYENTREYSQSSKNEIIHNIKKGEVYI